MADEQAQREVPAAARAEHRRGAGPERLQQRRRVVGLLLGEVLAQPAGAGLRPFPRRS